MKQWQEKDLKFILDSNYFPECIECEQRYFHKTNCSRRLGGPVELSIPFEVILVIFIIMCSLFANGESKDVLDVAWVIYNEAQGESYQGKEGVATVIYNRAMSKRKTYQQIVKETKQFAYFEPSSTNNIYFDQCLTLSKQLHDDTFKPLADWNCFFNPDKCTPYWYKSMTNKHIIQHHLFGVIKL